MGRAVAAARGFPHRGLELGVQDVDRGVGEVRQASAVVDVEVRDEDVLDVGRREPEPFDLAHSRLVLVQRRPRHLHPGRAEGVGRVADVVEAEPCLDEDQAVSRRFDEQAVVHGRGRERTFVGRVDLAHGTAVQVVDLHVVEDAT